MFFTVLYLASRRTVSALRLPRRVSSPKARTSQEEILMDEAKRPQELVSLTITISQERWPVCLSSLVMLGPFVSLFYPSHIISGLISECSPRRSENQWSRHSRSKWYTSLSVENSLSYANLYTVAATQAISNVVKSSFGPSGLDKMMVDDIGVRNAHFY